MSSPILPVGSLRSERTEFPWLSADPASNPVRDATGSLCPTYKVLQGLNQVFGVVALMLLLGLWGGARAQGLSGSEAQSLLDQVNRDYKALRYEEARSKGLLALEEYQRFTPKQLVSLHTTLAFVEYALGRQDSARMHFEAALSLDPELQLDPVYTSPKIMALFDEVKRRIGGENTPHGAGAASVQIRYLLVKDRRPAAALRSLIWPGLGQWYKGQRRKATVLMSASAVSAAAIAGLYVAENRARDEYLSAPSPAAAQAKYDSYNRVHKMRQAATLVAASLWIYGFADALWASSPIKMDKRLSLQIESFGGSSRPMLALRLAW